MCGIFGIVTANDEALGPLLIEAAKRLTYRGYDSVGIATISGGLIDLRKDAGRVPDVAERLHMSDMRGTRGIAQLRWATFGEPSRANSQPHLDSEGRMVGAHNGNVVNNAELRREFAAEGMEVRSDNDGESCVHAVERFVRRGHCVAEAVRMAHAVLQGDYAFVVGRLGEETLVALKKGSGLVVGVGEGFTCVSSDLPSILPLTRRVVRVEDGEIVTLWHDRVELRAIDATGCCTRVVERAPEVATVSIEAATKGGHAHFMLKEIREQGAVARELLHVLGASNDARSVAERLRAARNVFLVGCGTSYHACVAGSVFLSRVAGRVAIPVLAPQFAEQYAGGARSGDVGVFVSQSGETKDVLSALQAARARGVACFGVTNVVGSSLAKAAEAALPLCCGYEISVPATKTFTNQLVLFLYLALCAAGKAPDDELRGVPGLIEATLDQCEPQVRALVPALNQWDDLYCLGLGTTLPAALEGALKLKEITYAHCEGMLSTEFKHGPLSAVTEGFPVVFVAPPDQVPAIVSGLNEVACRGARAVVVGQDDPRLRAYASDVVALPQASPEVTALLAVLPLQLMSYHMSVMRGYDPDFPRNLSKTLTVD
eukprot:m51a1_g13791 putative glucosamine--fructose-6-phosphate aminotransferase (601) ;mRNA; f:339902-341704